MMRAKIHVRFDAVGFHHWKDAPAHRAYLSWIHRHVFHVEVTTTVEHHNREIEFHDLIDAAKRMFEVMLESGAGVGWSCEAMANHLALALKEVYRRDFTVSVFEDGECGATVET